jgi:two-component system sensor histidine kinase RpfC
MLGDASNMQEAKLSAIPGSPAEKASTSSLFLRLRTRLRNRPDTEHEMTPNRLVFAGSVVLYLLVATWLGNSEARAMLAATDKAFFVYFCIAIAIFVHIVWRPQASVIRRLLAMVADFSMISIAAAEGGIATGFFFPFYLWTIFGNGFRFGIPFLYAAMLVGNIGFLTVLAATGIWREHFGLSVALTLCVIMLPLYAGNLIKKLSEAKEQAEKADRAKSAFLASVSHELRTPLNAIIGLGDLLRSQIQDSEQKQMMQVISNAGRTLLKLINTILDFSRLEAGRMPSTFADVDFYSEMGRIATMLAVSARTKSFGFNVHISARTPSKIYTDFIHIEQILVNLVANAIKFTDTGHVVVIVDAVRQEAENVRLRFEVRDTGIGIASEVQARIFDTFTQADSTILDRFGGTGLGLSISKQLVKLLNGEIGLDSEPGKGSTFWFEIDAKALSGDPERRPPINRRLILLKPDSELRGAVHKIGGDLLEAESGTELLDAVDRTGDVAPIVIVDQRELHETEIVAAMRTLSDEAGIIAIVDAAGAHFSDQLYIDCTTTVARPIATRDLRRAVQIAELKTKRMPDPPDATIKTHATTPLSILVAEDNRTNQLVIAKILERAGHHVTLVDNGQEALDAMQDTEFEVVLMDMNMPTMNGIEATKLYRFASLGEARVPIIALTADASSDAWQRCQDAGMDAYAVKPIDPAHLLEIIERVASQPKKSAAHVAPLTERSASSTVARSIDATKINDLKLLGGSDFIAELVSQFSMDSAKLLSCLSSAVECEDVQAFREAAHALRSSAGNVGAVNVSEACLAVRAITLNRLVVEGEDWIHQLEKEIKRFVALLGSCATNSAMNGKKVQPLTEDRMSP